jgi:hypothetical protein
MTDGLSSVTLVASAQTLNGVIWFALALGMAAICAWVAPTPNLKKWCWLLPIFKVSMDLARGVPDDAYLLGPFAAERWDLGRFQLGVGFEAPLALLSLEGQLGASMHGNWFSLAAGDMPVNALAVRGLGWVIPTCLCLLFLVGVLRVSGRVVGWVRFWRSDRAQAHGRIVAERHVVNGFQVRVIGHGDPARGSYTSGFFRPVVWLSPAVCEAPEDQLRAVIEHELAHVRQLDVPLFGLVRLAADALWFLPGIGLVARRVHRHAEIAADAAAVRRGCSPTALAGAIALECNQRLAHAGADLGGGAQAERVARLGQVDSPHRALRALRIIAFAYLCASLFHSGLFRHH